MKVLVTGGAGFIPSHLEDILIKNGHEVIAVDRVDAKKACNIQHLMEKDDFTYVKKDISVPANVIKLSKDCDMIFHLAANSDIQNGGKDPSIDYTNTFLTTRAVLEAMKKNEIKKMFFSSTSAVYGDIKGDLNEMTGGLKPISYYGAYKLASEAAISSYSYMNDFDALVFRFPNVVGPRLTHGVIFDFIRKLNKNPKKLQILGNGKQSKQYVYVKDLAEGIWKFSKKMESGMNIYGVSTESFTTVNEIADLVCERMGLDNVKYEYTGGSCGWKGDVPSFSYDITKAKKKGWKYKFDSTGSVRETLKHVDIDQLVSL